MEFLLVTILAIITGQIIRQLMTMMNFGLDITNPIQTFQSIILVLVIGWLLNQETA